MRTYPCFGGDMLLSVPLRAEAVIGAWKATATAQHPPEIADLARALDPAQRRHLVVSAFDPTGNYVLGLPEELGIPQPLPAGWKLNPEHNEDGRAAIYRDYSILHACRCGMWTRWRGKDTDEGDSFAADSCVLPLASAQDGRLRIATFHFFATERPLQTQIRQTDLEKTLRRWLDLGFGVPYLSPRRF